MFKLFWVKVKVSRPSKVPGPRSLDFNASRPRNVKLNASRARNFLRLEKVLALAALNLTFLGLDIQGEGKM